MVILTVAGKADSRVIVYPLAFMLKNYGRVAIASDDDAYRRLYHGFEDVGECCGVSVAVYPRLTAELMADEVNKFSPEFLICITNGYVPEFTTHLLVMTGYDRSFDGGNAHTKEEHEAGIDVSMSEVDKVQVPPNLPIENVREIIVSTSPIKSKTALSVCLKDGLLLHAARCEEYKKLLPHESRDFLEILMKLFCPFIVPSVADVPKLFGFKK
jgi:hypothetical protein